MASTYLTRTPTTENINKLTLSCWVKRGSLGSTQRIFSNTSSEYLFYRFESSDQFRFTIVVDGGETTIKTNRLFRDTNAWYHLVVRWDTTQSTEADRIKLYVNGVQETSFNLATYPALNSTSDMFNSGTPFEIGRYDGANNEYFVGSMSHLHCCSGYAYDASYFGSTDSTTGEWKINTSPSVTYGTNGFFILKDGNSVTDQSPNTNNFTVGGGTLTKTEDCPSNVFATINPLSRNATSANNNTLSYGNNRQTTMSISGVYTPSPSTLGMTSGKYYAEMKVDTMPGNCFVGIDGDASNTVRQGINMGSSPNAYCYAQWGGKYHNGTSVANAGATFGAGDIVGIAVDLDNNKLYFSKNGTWQNSGDPTSGSTGTGAFYTIASADSTAEGAYFFEACNNDHTGNGIFDWNFGNGYFGTTAVSSAGTNASGIGIFEYDVPTGYTA